MVEIMRKAEQEFDEVVSCGVESFARKPQHADGMHRLGFWLFEWDELQIVERVQPRRVKRQAYHGSA